MNAPDLSFGSDDPRVAFYAIPFPDQFGFTNVVVEAFILN